MNIPKRSAGILLPVSSLPKDGFVEAAKRWVDFLTLAGQSYWQILPLTIPGPGGSPYYSLSAFALEQVEPDAPINSAELDNFRSENSYWLPDFVKIMSEQFGGDKEKYERIQCTAFKRWDEIHRYANAHGVEIIGDMPMYVAMDGVDVIAHPELFDGGAVAGVPPDAFSDEGQHWGNPLYNWNKLKHTGFEWWIERIRHSLKLVDVLRIDHFRALESYWAIPEGGSAKDGEWRFGPGMSLMNTIKYKLPNARLIAEDLGVITDEVRTLLENSKLPGMKVLQFAFDGGSDNLYLAHNIGENYVVYTGTHDNDTTLGWANSGSGAVERAKLYLGVHEASELPRAMILLAYRSRAKLAVIPMQDWLELDSEARINTPSTVSEHNWNWKLDMNLLTNELADEMRIISEITGRK